MVNFVFGIFFIVLGGIFTNSALKLQRTQDIKLIKNKMVNMDKVKDKDSYIRFNFKINLIVSAMCIVQGLIRILATCFSVIDDLSWVTNIILMLTILVYSYKLIFKAPNF